MKKTKKVKKLKLKPSHRDKRRYFLVKEKNEEVEKAILDYLGILGFAKSAYLRVIDKELKDFTIGSCTTKYLSDIRAALALEGIKIEKVSSTIKALKNNK